MTLTQLEYVISIADSGSFVEAAKKCFVTQPALTTQVKNLEQELGVILFDRTKKPISPTDVGRQVIEQAREVIYNSRKISDVVTDYTTDIKGDLSLGIIPTVSPYLVPLFINEFNQEVPKVNLNVEECITEEILQRLKIGDLDVGIIATPAAAKGVVNYPLYYEEFFGYVSENHPLYYKESIEAAKIKSGELWLLKEGNCFRNQVVNVCNPSGDVEFHEHFRYESHSIESLKAIVSVKSGVTLIPELALGNLIKSHEKRIKKISDIHPYREISLVMSKHMLKKRLIDRLREVILNTVPKHMLEEKAGVVDPGVSFN